MIDIELIFFFWGLGDHKEGYYIGIEVPKDDPHWDKPFYGPNPWPDAG